ncbi:MAG: hypothetical protein Q9196_002896 [Gyalolechia fulgens]
MSRTIADATRFTATSPHAYSKPASILRSAAKTFSPSFTASGSGRLPPKPAPPFSSNPASPPDPSKPPPNETPQQKVARLRALRAAAKLKPLPLWDRTVLRGRMWADRAHRITVYFLLMVTAIAAVVTVVSLGDMIIYNRRKRGIYYRVQEAIYNDTLGAAIAAEHEQRPFTAEETAVLNREKMILRAEAQKEKLKEIGWWKRITAYLSGDDSVDRQLRALQAADMGGEGGDADGGNKTGLEALMVTRVEDVVAPERVLRIVQEKMKEREKR